MTIVFALCGLLCAAVNDFIMKLFARKKRSRGLFFCLVGGFWAGACFLMPMDHTRWKMTLIWGCAAGFFSIVANLLLIESMRPLSAGICSTIYRSNLVPVAILACFLPYLNETITWYNAVGIVCAAVAVLCFMSNPGDRKHASVAKRAVTLGLFMVITASFLRAGQGLSSKYATVFEADIGGVMLVNAVFWIVGGLLYALLRERNLMKMDSPMIGYGVMSGGIVFGIIFFMLESTKGGNAAV